MSKNSAETIKLSRRLEKVAQTPASFAFFVAIHDFVEQFEAHKAFSKVVLPAKYRQLKEVYQSVEDIYVKQKGDLGHERYMNIQSMLRIRDNDVSENNSLWKKREVLRTVSTEVYELLNAA